MFGIRSKSETADQKIDNSNSDIAKLFFDSYSGRLSQVEVDLKKVVEEVERLRVSGDQSKLSDLVLLERLQQSEKILHESLHWIKQVADVALRSSAPVSSIVLDPTLRVPESAPLAIQPAVNQLSHRNDPSVVQAGSLHSITTPTELQVLTLLANEGPKSSPEIGRLVGRSREHTARLMKRLFEEGYVRRDQSRIPFRYSTVERVKQSFIRSQTEDPVEETASAPPA